MGKPSYYLNKFKGKSVNEIIAKSINRIKQNTFVEVNALKYKFCPKKLKNKNFYDFKTNSIFLNVKRSDLNENLEYKNKIRVEADKICNHELPLLGLEDCSLGKSLEWNKDYKSNYIWKNNYYKKIELVNYFNSSDVKIPWEISRFQHLFTLGKAYLLTKDDKYSKEFVEEIEHWIENNPIEYSVNWTCAMEVAIRAMNWIIAYYLFKDSPKITKEFWSKFNSTLYYHGIFIMNNLENKKHTTNHYLSDLAGLVWLGIYFKNYKHQSNHIKWLNFGLNQLENELEIQINNDGTDYETSTSYHRLVTEIYLYTKIFCNKNSVSVSNKFLYTIEKMLDFIYVIMKEDGKVPMIGDADDGRIFITNDYYCWNRNDFRGVLALGSIISNKNYLDNDLDKYKEELLWIFNIQELKKVYEKKKARSLNFSYRYDDGGYYLLKNKSIYCCIRCGKLSCNGQGGHSHNDQLSFELSYDKEDLFIDPGVFVYTANVDERNLYRSTRMHNTVEINGLEQNEISKYKLFEMKEQSFGEIVEFTDSSFKGKHRGYLKKLGVEHIRTINITDNYIHVNDNVINKENRYYDCKANFILDYDVNIIEEDNNLILCKNNIKYKLEITAIKFFINEVYISKQYGKRIKSKKLTFIFNDTFDMWIRRII